MEEKINNSDRVQELVDGRWSMDQDEFEEKYALLSDNDKSIVSKVIDNMSNEWISEYDEVECLSEDEEEEEEEEERLSVYDAALIWLSNGKDEDYMFGYTVEELESAL